VQPEEVAVAAKLMAVQAAAAPAVLAAVAASPANPRLRHSPPLWRSPTAAGPRLASPATGARAKRPVPPPHPAV